MAVVVDILSAFIGDVRGNSSEPIERVIDNRPLFVYLPTLKILAGFYPFLMVLFIPSKKQIPGITITKVATLSAPIYS